MAVSCWCVPGETAWVDVILPAGDPLWDDDIARAAHWLGRAWQSALAELGVAPTEVHEGPLACGPLGRLVCFATVGAGEVTVPGGDGPRKVVGISQRRTRAAARFQCAAYRRWDPDPLARLLRLDDEGRRALADAAVGTGHRAPGRPGRRVPAPAACPAPRRPRSQLGHAASVRYPRPRNAGRSGRALSCGA